MKLLKYSLMMLAAVGMLTNLTLSSYAQENPLDLNNTRWQVVSFGAVDAETPVLEDSPITLEFLADGSITGKACNIYNATYTLSEDALSFSPIVSTRMACEEAINAQEHAYFAALQNSSRAELVGSELLLWDAAGENVVRLMNDETLGLLDSQWQLISSQDASGEYDVTGDNPPTLRLSSEGELAGSGGCNSYGGVYVLNGDLLNFGEIASTKMACADAVNAQEAAFFEALATVSRYELRGDELTLWYGEDGASQLHLVTGSTASLVNSRWTLLRRIDGDIASAPLEGFAPTLEFYRNQHIAGSGGCNGYNGSYQVDAQNGLLFSQLVSTEMACVEGVNAQETAYLEALSHVTRYQFEDGLLILWFGEGEMQSQLHFSRQTTDPLLNTRWQLSAFVDGDTQTAALSSPATTLEFYANNQVLGHGACNGYGGAYSVDGDTLSFSQVASTLMACEDAVNAQEARYYEALGTVSRYELSEGSLTLWYGDSASLVFLPLP